MEQGRNEREAELIKILVVEHLEAAVRHEYARHFDSVGSLIVFYNRCHDSWQGQCRAIQCVAQFYLLVVGSAIAAVQTISLITFEVGY